MTANRDTIHALRSLFEDDVTVLPDRVFDAVLADLPVTRQQRPILGRWRRPFRVASIRYAILVGVAVVAFAVGFTLYGNLGSVTGPAGPAEWLSGSTWRFGAQRRVRRPSA